MLTSSRTAGQRFMVRTSNGSPCVESYHIQQEIRHSFRQLKSGNFISRLKSPLTPAMAAHQVNGLTRNSLLINPLKTMNNVKELSIQRSPISGISLSFWKVPRLRPSALLVRAPCMKMSRDHWWNDTDRGISQYLEKNLSQCHSIHHKSHRD